MFIFIFLCVYIKYWLITIKNFFIICLYTYIKLVNGYCWKNTEKFQKEACARYQNLSEEEKEKRWKKVRERYKPFSAEEKEKKCQHHRDQTKNLSEEGKKNKRKLGIWEIII